MAALVSEVSVLNIQRSNICIQERFLYKNLIKRLNYFTFMHLSTVSSLCVSIVGANRQVNLICINKPGEVRKSVKVNHG